MVAVRSSLHGHVGGIPSHCCHSGRILKEQRKDDYQFTTTRLKASWDHHGGQHFILLVEPMFVLVYLAGLPGTPRRAFDAAGYLKDRGKMQTLP